MLKTKIFLIKIYSKSNYKTNIFFIFFKKKYKSKINFYYFIINFLEFKKKKLNSFLYLYIGNIYSKNSILYYGYFIFNKKNIYFSEIFNNYEEYKIFFFIKKTKIRKNISLKNIKKIFTNILVKKKKKIFESLKDRFIITFLYTFINTSKKIKKILKFYIKYSDENFFFFLKNIRKVCSIIYSNKEDYNNKLYLGFMKQENNNFPYYILFIINNLANKNIYKINISIEIYNFDLLKIIKKIFFFKKIKINLIINIPDLFIEFLIKKKNWYLFDSKIIKKEYNFYIQSFYDEYIGFGSFRKKYNDIIKNKKILKISINSKKIFLKIIKKNINIFFSDIHNRNNINKHIGTLLPNFLFNKIYDRNNFYNKQISFIKNANINVKRNNSLFIEIILKQNFNFCKNSIKKYMSKYKLLDFKNEFLIIQREINFHLNFRIRPIIIKFEKIKKNEYNYLFFNFTKINTLYSIYNFPYCWYPGSDYYNKNFFFKNKFISNKWKKLIKLIDINKIKNSLSLNINYKKKNNILTTFDNYLLKIIIIKWQLSK